jgi:hypothetical protein
MRVEVAQHEPTTMIEDEDRPRRALNARVIQAHGAGAARNVVQHRELAHRRVEQRPARVQHAARFGQADVHRSLGPRPIGDLQQGGDVGADIRLGHGPLLTW